MPELEVTKFEVDKRLLAGDDEGNIISREWVKSGPDETETDIEEW